MCFLMENLSWKRFPRNSSGPISSVHLASLIIGSWERLPSRWREGRATE